MPIVVEFWHPDMVRREREILEGAVHVVVEQAAKADELVKEAATAGGGNHPVTIHAKMLRFELLKVKADSSASLRPGAELHEVWPRRALGPRFRRLTGHQAHREPAPSCSTS